jgi:large subunit ribosomal protein L10
VNRSQKEAQVTELRQIFEAHQLMVVTHQTGLTVAEASELRNQMRDAGAKFRITKNRLAKIAIKESKFEQLADQFSGPTAIAVSEDPVAAAKIISEFAKTNDKLVILGGALNEKALDAAGVAALAKLPSLDDLRSKLIGVLQAPAGKLASILQAPAGQLARVVSAYSIREQTE